MSPIRSINRSLAVPFRSEVVPSNRWPKTVHTYLFEGFLVKLVDVVPDDRVARAVEEEDCASEDSVQGCEGAVQRNVLYNSSPIQAV